VRAHTQWFSVRETAELTGLSRVRLRIRSGALPAQKDGQELNPPIDLYGPSVVPTGPMSLGTHELAPGEHTLTVEIVGANPSTVKGYMFGLDWLKLEER